MHSQKERLIQFTQVINPVIYSNVNDRKNTLGITSRQVTKNRKLIGSILFLLGYHICIENMVITMHAQFVMDAPKEFIFQEIGKK